MRSLHLMFRPQPAIAGYGVHVPGFCAHPLLGVLAAEVEFQWRQALTECFKMQLLVSESSGAEQMSKLYLTTLYQDVAGSAHQEAPAAPRLSIASMCSWLFFAVVSR